MHMLNRQGRDVIIERTEYFRKLGFKQRLARKIMLGMFIIDLGLTGYRAGAPHFKYPVAFEFEETLQTMSTRTREDLEKKTRILDSLERHPDYTRQEQGIKKMYADTDEWGIPCFFLTGSIALYRLVLYKREEKVFF